MTTDTIGTTAANAVATGLMLGDLITPSSSGVLTTIGFNIAVAGGNMRLGIYSTYSGGKFSGLLGQSSSIPVTTGWNDYALSPTVNIVQSVAVYLSAMIQNPVSGYYNTSGTEYYATQAFGPFPDPSPALTTASVTDNLRITYSRLASVQTVAPTVVSPYISNLLPFSKRFPNLPVRRF